MHIAFITGSRAEWWLLAPLVKSLGNQANYHTLLFVTGSHLVPEFGSTWRQIEFPITERIPCVVSSDDPVGITMSAGLAMMGFGEAYARHKPDLVVVLGDRYEIFAAVSAAHIAGIPVAHIHGGEVTEGSIDDGFRHCITKMSQLHFTAAEEYFKRVIQLGERFSTVHCVGTLGADGLIRRKDHEPTNFYIVAYYGAPQDIDEIEKVLNSRGANFVVAQGSHDIACYMGRQNAYVVPRDQYLKDLAHADAIIGNSSSGIIEAPAMGVPTINIGDRQKGRLMAESIIQCSEPKDLWIALNTLHSSSFQELMKTDYWMPYKGGNVANQIAEIIMKSLQHGVSVRKGFYDL